MKNSKSVWPLKAFCVFQYESKELEKTPKWGRAVGTVMFIFVLAFSPV